MVDIDISESDAVEAITVTDVPTAPAISTMSVNPSINDGITVAEAVTTPTFTLKLYRGVTSVTVSAITEDWDFIQTYRQFSASGIPLKGIILMPGTTDTFSIKDGGESGAYLYYGALAAAAVLVYPGTHVKPFIDFSECTLNTGHKITFVW